MPPKARRYKYGSKKRPKKFMGTRTAGPGRKKAATLASPGLSLSSQPVPLATTSGEKVDLALQSGPLENEPEPAEPGFATYQLIRTSSLLRFLEALTCCVSCGLPIELTENRSCRRGLVTKLTGVCTGCGKSENLTDPYREEDLEINGRSVLAARAMGKGRSGLKTFTTMMGIGTPVSSPAFTRHNQLRATKNDDLNKENDERVTQTEPGASEPAVKRSRQMVSLEEKQAPAEAQRIELDSSNQIQHTQLVS